VRIQDDLILLLGPFVFTDIRVEVVVPALSALFSDAAGQLLGDEAPVFGAVFIYESQHQFVLVFGLDEEDVTHGPLTREGLRTFCHRWRHCTSVLFSKKEAIFFQFFAPYYYISCCSFSSS